MLEKWQTVLSKIGARYIPIKRISIQPPFLREIVIWYNAHLEYPVKIQSTIFLTVDAQNPKDLTFLSHFPQKINQLSVSWSTACGQNAVQVVPSDMFNRLVPWATNNMFLDVAMWRVSMNNWLSIKLSWYTSTALAFKTSKRIYKLDLLLPALTS